MELLDCALIGVYAVIRSNTVKKISIHLVETSKTPYLELWIYTITKCIQLTLVISNSRGLSEILRDIRTSTYQICRIEEKLIRLTTFNKYMVNIWLYEVRDILKIL